MCVEVTLCKQCCASLSGRCSVCVAGRDTQASWGLSIRLVPHGIRVSLSSLQGTCSLCALTGEYQTTKREDLVSFLLHRFVGRNL